MQMEPQLPKPQFNTERSPSSQGSTQGGEVFAISKSFEASPPLERTGETHETASMGVSGDPVAQPFVPPPLPVIDPAQSPATTTAQVRDDSNPVVASDDDLIEKEWVEKAKRVVAETRDDPHAQDLAVGRLQADYLKKRYGRMAPSSSSKEG